jgi:aspartate/methionine/tyrosine aminotransferase
MITSENDSIMLPIPQFPLYSAVINLNGGNKMKNNFKIQ